jgi:hypothetical protein
MANWNEPTNSTLTVNVLSILNEKIANTAKLDYGSDTNLPTGAVRFNDTLRIFQEWNGSAWVTLPVSIPSAYHLGPYTLDAADNQSWTLGGGGAAGSSRGATVTLRGNEVASTGGEVVIEGGAISTGHVSIRVNDASAEVRLLDNAGAVLWRVQNDGDLLFSKSYGLIAADTVDGSDNKAVLLAGGGAYSSGRGAGLLLGGNESGETGRAALVGGNVSGGHVSLQAIHSSAYVDVFTGGNLQRWVFTSGGDLNQNGTNGGSVTLTRASTCVTPGVCTTGISAAGSARTDATALTAFFNHVTTVSAGQGVALWNAPQNAMIVVHNTGANALNVYPESGTATINGGSGGGAVAVAAGTLNFFFKTGASAWRGVEFTASVA